jgi:hypothetical protein
MPDPQEIKTHRARLNVIGIAALSNVSIIYATLITAGTLLLYCTAGCATHFQSTAEREAWAEIQTHCQALEDRLCSDIYPIVADHLKNLGETNDITRRYGSFLQLKDAYIESYGVPFSAGPSTSFYATARFTHADARIELKVNGGSGGVTLLQLSLSYPPYQAGEQMTLIARPHDQPYTSYNRFENGKLVPVPVTVTNRLMWTQTNSDSRLWLYQCYIQGAVSLGKIK